MKLITNIRATKTSKRPKVCQLVKLFTKYSLRVYEYKLRKSLSGVFTGYVGNCGGGLTWLDGPSSCRVWEIDLRSSTLLHVYTYAQTGGWFKCCQGETLLKHLVKVMKFFFSSSWAVRQRKYENRKIFGF